MAKFKIGDTYYEAILTYDYTLAYKERAEKGSFFVPFEYKVSNIFETEKGIQYNVEAEADYDEGVRITDGAKEEDCFVTLAECEEECAKRNTKKE